MTKATRRPGGRVRVSPAAVALAGAVVAVEGLRRLPRAMNAIRSTLVLLRAGDAMGYASTGAGGLVDDEPTAAESAGTVDRPLDLPLLSATQRRGL